MIAENPYLQYFLGLHEYRYECPFDPSMMSRFRQRITPEMLAWVNDQIIGRQQAEEKDDGDQDDSNKDDSNPPDAGGDETLPAQADEKMEEPVNEGTLILDATCVPQNIRFPTDSSLLNEAREKTEEIIDILHEHGKLDDPRHLIMDVTHVGHHGNGDCQIKITNTVHMGYIKDLILAHYHNVTA